MKPGRNKSGSILGAVAGAIIGKRMHKMNETNYSKAETKDEPTTNTK